MKNYTQVYVRNSMEAAKTYCRAFGAEITLEMKDDSGTAYEHCELSVDGEGFLDIRVLPDTQGIDRVVYGTFRRGAIL